MSDPRDDLDELLIPKSGPEPAGLREALFTRTARRLAWARWTRRVAAVAAVVAVFAAGGVLGWLAKPERLAVERVPGEPVFVFVPMPVPTQPPVADAPDSPKPEPRPAPVSATEAELLAEQSDDPAEVARLYRLAGDRYLNDRQDYANAARCYRMFLASAGDGGLSPEPGDTWLLTSLKNAAFKEKANVSKTDG
jgi:hypothetical protein